MTKLVIPVLAAIGTLFLVAALAQKPSATQQLAVYDSGGKKVGDVTGAQYYLGPFVPQVSFKVEDFPFMLLVFRDGFVQGSEVLWESAACSGAPFVLGSTSYGHPMSSSMPIVAVGLPGSTVYVEDGPARVITVRSYSSQPVLGTDPSLGSSQCGRAAPFLSSYPTYPARPLINMDTEFKPPFTVR